MLERLEKLFDEFRDLGEPCRDLITWLTAFGIVVLLIINIKFLFSLLGGIKLYFIDQKLGRSSCCHVDLVEKYGQWAVVSGATDGIGLAMARELVRTGMSIIVIGRNEQKLATTKTTLENEENAGQVVTIKTDFQDCSLKGYEDLKRSIYADNRDIGILINNVGVYTRDFVGFEKEKESMLKALIDVNITPAVMLTRAIVPSMIRNKGGTGLVVNVSSMGGGVNFPLCTIYPSTKAFINSFSKLLQFEYRKYPNLKVVNLTTGPVWTNRIAEAAPDFQRQFNFCLPTSALVTPEKYARSVMNILTRRSHPLEFSGLASHGLYNNILKFFDSHGLLAPLIEKLLPLRQS